VEREIGGLGLGASPRADKPDEFRFCVGPQIADMGQILPLTLGLSFGYKIAIFYGSEACADKSQERKCRLRKTFPAWKRGLSDEMPEVPGRESR
jgi:hypothetical protein